MPPHTACTVVNLVDAITGGHRQVIGAVLFVRTGVAIVSTSDGCLPVALLRLAAGREREFGDGEEGRVEERRETATEHL